MISHWILDGYNIMHALQYFPSAQSLEITRARFLHWVRGFHALGDKKITIVFDNQVHPQSLSEGGSNMQVLYAPSGLNADGMIIEIIRKTPVSSRSSLTIVTRDLLLRDDIFSYGCTVVSPEAFLQEFYRVRSHADTKATSHQKSFYRPFEEFFKNLSVDKED